MKIIAEISANHNQDFGRCIALIQSAYDSGADFIKLQCYDGKSICHQDDEEKEEMKDGLWSGQSLSALYKKAETPMEWFPKIFDYCYKKNIPVFSSVFCMDSLDLMKDLNAPMIKIASTEAYHGNLLQECLKYDQVPLLISLGKVYDLHHYFQSFEDVFSEQLKKRRKSAPIYFLASDCTYSNSERSTVVRDMHQLLQFTRNERAIKFNGGEFPVKYGIGYSHNSNVVNQDMINSLCYMDAQFFEIHFDHTDHAGIDGAFSVDGDKLFQISQFIKEAEERKFIQKPDNGINLCLRDGELRRGLAPHTKEILFEKL